MNISIIIPNYNGENLLKKNLPVVYEAVRHYRHGKVEIIIPDDPSTDNSEKVIKNFIANIKDENITGKTISNKNKTKAGFSKNVNRGVSLATGDILILLNSDVYPRNNFLDYLIPHFSDTNVFAVGCMDESIENGQKILRGRGVGKWYRGLLIHSKGEVDKNNTLWASGGSSAFNKKIWDKLGGLEELYNPFYWEDIDISYRALKSGYKILFENKSIVVHEHNEGAIKSSFKKYQIIKTAYKNQFIFVWLNITDQKLIISHLFWLPYHLLSALLRRDILFIQGLFLAFLKMLYIIKKRKIYTKHFKITDFEILSKFKT